jgi:ABC-type Fe3+/spermidine/putrescine transport system ATPase subunit
VGPPDAIYLRPSTRFVASFVGTGNFIEGVVGDRRGSAVEVRTPTGSLETLTDRQDLPAGATVQVLVRPEHVRLVADPADAVSTDGGEAGHGAPWIGEISNRAFLGDTIEYLARVADRTIRVRSHPTLRLEIGSRVGVEFPPEHVSILD